MEDSGSSSWKQTGITNTRQLFPHVFNKTSRGKIKQNNLDANQIDNTVISTIPESFSETLHSGIVPGSPQATQAGSSFKRHIINFHLWQVTFAP